MLLIGCRPIVSRRFHAICMALRRELVPFGAAVRHYRSRLSLSQDALAERSVLHRTYVSGIERGQRNVGLSTSTGARGWLRLAS
jgi:DNA-binding XRE family transcriptional regulator